jgi:PAS domain S-box-containing protein
MTKHATAPASAPSDSALARDTVPAVAVGASGGEADLRRQLQQLQVHQIELEMQNAALAAIEAQRDMAEADLERFATLYDQAPAGFLSVTRDGRICRANLAAANLLGRPRPQLLGRPFEQFVAPDAQAALRRFLAGVFASGAHGALELPLFGGDGAGDGGAVRIEANLDPAGPVCRMVLATMGDQHAREAARRRAFQVLDSIEEGVLVCDRARRIVAVNPAFSRCTGYRAEEALGRDPAFLGRPGAHPAGYHTAAREHLLAHGVWQGEVCNQRRDGTPFTAQMSMTLVRGEDGVVDYYIGVFADISERKRAEQALLDLSRELDARVVARTAELTAANVRLRREVAERKRAEAALQRSGEQLRLLAGHLATIKEQERKRISREIHDELGQNLLALRLDIAALRARTQARHPRLRQRVDAALGNVDATIRSVRGIINDLRPAVLDLGLQPALEWQAAEFRKRSGLACRLLLPPEAVLETVDPELAIVLFRSLQEALTNVLRHAGATDVDVRLTVEGGRLELRIADNGVGIAPGQRTKTGSFGLIGIGERVAALGGRFEVEPFVPGRGGVLTLCFDAMPARGAENHVQPPEEGIYSR